VSKNHEKLQDTWENSYKDIGIVKIIFFIKKSILIFFFVKMLKNRKK